MIRHALGTLLLAGAAALPAMAMDPPGNAQKGLTPTDVVDLGEVWASARFSALFGQGKAEDLVNKADVDITDFQVQLSGAVGLGMGIEVTFDIPCLFRGTTDMDVSSVSTETQQLSEGFGDLTLSGVYRILQEGAATPQWVVSAIVVAPVGNDFRGDSEVTVSGTTVRDGDTAGNGEGVWHYGFGSAISKQIGMLEPYLGFSYVFGGKRQHNGVNEDRADVATLIAGSELHISPETTIDLRSAMFFNSKDVTEDNRARITEEAFNLYAVQATAYITIAPSVTLLAGFGVGLMDDHLLDTSGDASLNDMIYYQGMIGLHVCFGLGGP